MTIPTATLHEILREMTKDTLGMIADRIVDTDAPHNSWGQGYDIGWNTANRELFKSDEIILACVRDYVFRADDEFNEAEDKDTAISRTLSVSGQDYEVWVYLDGGFTIYDIEGENILIATETGIATIDEDGSYVTDNDKLCDAVRAAWGIGVTNAAT